jgi:hypothetical protein
MNDVLLGFAASVMLAAAFFFLIIPGLEAARIGDRPDLIENFHAPTPSLSELIEINVHAAEAYHSVAM